MRLLLCGSQRNAKTDVYDATQRASTGEAGDSRADESFSSLERPGHRRLLELSRKEKIKPFKPRPPDAPDGTWRMQQEDIDRVQEFRKCIECFLCQDVCHVLRDHQMHERFIGPRFLIHVAALEMHPLDTEDRIDGIAERAGDRLLQHHQMLHKRLP